MESKNIQAYKKSRLEALEIYKNTHKVFFPALNNYVYFTAEGFNHSSSSKSLASSEIHPNNECGSVYCRWA